MKKLIAIIFMTTLLFGDICQEGLVGQYDLGNEYEQIVDKDNSFIPSVKIHYTGSRDIDSNQKLNFSTSLIGNYKTNSFYYWTSSCDGMLTSRDDRCGNVVWQPSKSDTTRQCKIKLYFGDGDGKLVDDEMTFNVNPYDGSINEDPDNSNISTNLLTQYIPSTKKFKVAWQSHGEVEQIVVSYSYDSNSWQTLFSQNLGTVKSSSKEVDIADSENHNAIYFKVESKNIINDISVMGSISTLNYTPSKPYVEKGTDIPVAPRLYSLGSEVDRDSIKLLWQRVNDSKYHDNVSYYEIKVANNRAFDNARIINAGNNAKGENLYESCSYVVDGLEDGKRAYFRVRAVNALGAGEWSNYESILVQIQDKPILDSTPLFPQVDAVGISKSPLFRWKCSDIDEDELEFYISLGEAPDKLYQDSGWIATHAQGTQEINYEDFKSKVALKPNTKYYWQVKVREQGRKKEYYGGEYISSPIWSFTTQAVGSDLSITTAQLISEVKPNKPATFRVTVKNVGTEVARQERIQAFYKKGGNTFQFWDGSKYMQKTLASGESETLDVEVKFRDDIWEKNGVTYDNVLVSGDSTVIFDFKKVSDQDINSANNKKEVTIHYENAGLPVFKHFWVYVQGIEKSKIRGIIGEPFQIYFGVSDDTKVSKAIVDYKLNKNDSWKPIKTITNDDDYLQGDFDWNIPNDRNLISDDVELRVRAYEANGVDYSEKIAKFPIYSNTLEIKNFTFDRDSYTVGDRVIISYDLIHDYDIYSLEVVLRNPDTGERKYIVKDKYIELGTQPTGTIQFTIPDDNEFSGESLYLDIEMYDIHYVKTIKKEVFPLVKVNNKLPSPFNSFIEVYKTLNTNFPSDAEDWGRNSYNIVKKTIIDNNNVVHMVVASKISYWASDYSYTDIDYFYVTYNYNTKQLSSVVKIASRNRNNLIFFKDFILIENEPFILFQKDGSQYYLSHKNGSSFTNLQEVLNKSTIKNNTVDFAQYNSKLYIKWIDTENGTSSVDRRNKRKEVYPNIGSEGVIHNEYLGYNTRVNNGHLYADCGKIFAINDDLTINSLLFEAEDKYCRDTGEFKDFSTTHNVIDFLPVSSGYGYVKLIKSDFSTVLLDTENKKVEVAVYDDKVITVGYLNNKNIVSVYDTNFNKISELSFGKYTEYSDVYAQADINKNKIMAVSRLENRRAYLTVADLSNDITAPNITLSNSETIIEVGDSINLTWTANDNNNELVRYEVYKLSNGEEDLLATITDINSKSFTYTQESTTDKFIQLKVVAYDASGNSNYATLPLKVQKSVTFNSFTIDKNEINLGEKVTFTWSSSVGDDTTQFTVYKKATDEAEWSRLFTTMGTSKAYVVKDFVGEVSFKIVVGNNFIEADNTLTVNGELLKFKESQFKPQGNFYKVNNHIKFEWVDTLTTPVSYDIWLKKSTESQFIKIGTTSDKFLDYFEDINSSFEWKVSAQFGEAIEESKVVLVTVKTLQSPSILDINFTLVNDEPIIDLGFESVEGVENYIILKEYNGIYEEIPITQNRYSDRNINYGVQYTYAIVAINNGIRAEQGESKTIVASLNEQYEVIVDTANNQLLDSNDLTLQYHPNKTVKYEKYEIWVGTAPDSLMLYDVIGTRSYSFTNLKYATNYFVEIYPIDLNGNHISATPAKLKFTTGFDMREITTKPIITIDEVNGYSIHLSWISVENTDEYRVCRSDNGGRYNCFVRTKELSYIDSVNIEPQNSYRYKIQAVNGFNFSISDATDEIVTPLNNGLRVIKDIANLTFDAIKLQNSAENNITGDLNLIKIGENKSNISWTTTSSVINIDTGSVERTSLENDLNVTLKASVQYGDSNDSVEFYLVVKKIEVTDSDGDGIPDDRETELGLNPNSNDSDGDGYLDSEEIGDVNSPLDTDNDGIINALDTDSDGDGVSDKEEREQGTDYLDGGDKPEALGITLVKTNYKLGLGLRDINISLGVTGGDVKVTILNNEQDIFTTAKQWSGEWIDTNDYEDEGLRLTLKALKAESGLISIEVEDRAGESIKEDIFIEVIDIADFVENQSTPAHLEDVNQSCIDMGARLPTHTEINDAYMVVDNYLTTVDALWTSTAHPTQSGHLKFKGRDASYPWVNAAFDTASTHCVKVQPIVDTDLVTVSLPKGWSNIALSPMTFEELVAKIGFENLLIMQGALPQSSYRKLFIDQGRPYLNSLENIKYGQGYWIKLDEAVEFTYNKAKYSGTQEILLKEGWNNVASLYALTLGEIQEQLGMDNVLIIQGALPQSSYKKLFVDQGRPYLNSFEKFEPNQGYWIKLDHEAKLIYEFDLDEVARSNANNDLVRIETIDGTEYTLKLFTNSQPQTETTNEAIIFFGLIDGTNITMGLNSSYPNDSKFQMAVYDSDGNEVGRSEIVDFAEDSIDFGSLLIEG